MFSLCCRTCTRVKTDVVHQSHTKIRSYGPNFSSVLPIWTNLNPICQPCLWLQLVISLDGWPELYCESEIWCLRQIRSSRHSSRARRGPHSVSLASRETWVVPVRRTIHPAHPADLLLMKLRKISPESKKRYIFIWTQLVESHRRVIFGNLYKT